jgi:hypothetical protein
MISCPDRYSAQAPQSSQHQPEMTHHRWCTDMLGSNDTSCQMLTWGSQNHSTSSGDRASMLLSTAFLNVLVSVHVTPRKWVKKAGACLLGRRCPLRGLWPRDLFLASCRPNLIRCHWQEISYTHTEGMMVLTHVCTKKPSRHDTQDEGFHLLFWDSLPYLPSSRPLVTTDVLLSLWSCGGCWEIWSTE